MARPQKFTSDEILDAAADAVATRWRDATIGDVAQRVGAPVGSIYHRFGSREELFVSLWLRSIRRFHAGLVEAATDPDPHNALLRCALHLPRFCREHPLDAGAMTLYRQPDLLEDCPPTLREDVVHLNDEAFGILHSLASRRYRDVGPRHIALVKLAVGESPYGLVRRHLREAAQIPEWMDDVVMAASTAILNLGDLESS